MNLNETHRRLTKLWRKLIRASLIGTEMAQDKKEAIGLPKFSVGSRLRKNQLQTCTSFHEKRGMTQREEPRTQKMELRVIENYFQILKQINITIFSWMDFTIVTDQGLLDDSHFLPF